MYDVPRGVAEDLRIAFLQSSLFWQVSCAKIKTKARTEISAWTKTLILYNCQTYALTFLKKNKIVYIVSVILCKTLHISCGDPEIFIREGLLTDKVLTMFLLPSHQLIIQSTIFLEGVLTIIRKETYI